MRPTWLMAALLLSGLASPAFAAIYDPTGAGAGEFGAIQAGFEEIKADDFEVILQAGAPPDGLDAEAARQFVARGYGPQQAVFVVDVPGKAIGVFLGQSFVDQGIVGETLRNRIDVAFGEAAREDDVDLGVIDLARQLKVMRATGVAAPFQMPWGMLGGGLAAMAGMFAAHAWRRRRDRRQALADRLGTARREASRVPASLQALRTVIDGRGRSGASVLFASRLLQVGEAAAAEAAAVLELVRANESALAAGRESEAGQAALGVEQRAFLAEAALAAARTAAADLDHGVDVLKERIAAVAPADAPETPALAEARRAAEAADPIACLAALARHSAGRPGVSMRGPADLLAECEAAARDWQALRAAQAHLAAVPGGGGLAAQVMYTRLRELRVLLTVAPVRLDEAESGLKQIMSQLAAGRTPVRVQRIAAGEAKADVLWDLVPARFMVVSGGEGSLEPAARGERGRM